MCVGGGGDSHDIQRKGLEGERELFSAKIVR